MCKWLLYLNCSGREPNIQISYNLYRRTKNTFKISFATFWTLEFVTNVYNSTQSLIKSRWRVRGGHSTSKRRYVRRKIWHQNSDPYKAALKRWKCIPTGHLSLRIISLQGDKINLLKLYQFSNMDWENFGKLRIKMTEKKQLWEKLSLEI